MSSRSDWYEEQRFREERAADRFERDIQREPRAPFVRPRRTHGGDELRNRLTETIAETRQAAADAKDARHDEKCGRNERKLRGSTGVDADSRRHHHDEGNRDAEARKPQARAPIKLGRFEGRRRLSHVLVHRRFLRTNA